MNSPCSDKIFPGPDHNHDRCLKGAITKARQTFADRKLRLTPLREQIYRRILTARTALGAYEIRDHFIKNNRDIAPITVYRILDLLNEIGLIHRLTSKNSYYACYHDHKGKTAFVTLICQGCGEVAELLDEKIEKLIGKLEKTADFHANQRMLEIDGLCARCRQTDKESD